MLTRYKGSSNSRGGPKTPMFFGGVPSRPEEGSVKPPHEGRPLTLALIRTISSLNCSTTTRVVVGRRCGSCGAGLCRLYHNGPLGTRCRAAHNRAGHTAYGGSNWPAYHGACDGTPRCSGQSTVVIGGSYCRNGKKRRTGKGNN